MGSKQGAQSVPCKDWLEPPEGLMLLSGLLTSGVIQEQPYWQEAGGLWDVVWGRSVLRCLFLEYFVCTRGALHCYL